MKLKMAADQVLKRFARQIRKEDAIKHRIQAKVTIIAASATQVQFPVFSTSSARFLAQVLKLVGEGQSYREISHRLGLSKNTVLDIVKRDRAT
jgi:DNA-binding NarL/FixJ family response regulator